MIGRVALLVTFEKAKPKSQSLSRSHIRDLGAIKLLMNRILLSILCCGLLLGCNPKTNQDFEEDTSEKSNAYSENRDNRINILEGLIRELKEDEFDFNKLKPWREAEFQRDTILASTLQDVVFYNYELEEVILFYSNPPYNYTNPGKATNDSIQDLIRVLKQAEHICGTEYGKSPNTAEYFIDVWSFQDDTLPSLAANRFNELEFQVFPKTMSFAFHHEKQLIIFRARYMGASWELKKHAEQFLSYLKNGT